MTDFDLLLSYASSGSEDAFASLVQRYANLVYSAALRQTRNHYEAEEISQVVFIILARKAGTIRKESVLAGWLLRTTRLVALNASRRQTRRRRTEREAAISSLTESEDVWKKIAPFLDEALVSLRDKDRDVLMLRFFEQKSFKEIGQVLGTSDDSAQKRVSRALIKLRRICARRTGAVPSTIFGAAIMANAVQAAPGHFAASTIAAVTSGSAAAAGVATLTSAGLSALNNARLRRFGLQGAAVLVTLVITWWALQFTKEVTHSYVATSTEALPSQAVPAIGGNASRVAANFRQLRLHVVDSQTGSPIRNVRAVANWASLPNSPTNVAVTDSLGECPLVFRPSPDDYWNFLIQISKNGYVSKFVSWAEARGDRIEDIPTEYTVRLTRGLIIGGLVLGNDGEPISNARVELAGPAPNFLPPGPPEREGVALTHTETTDSQGRWICDHVPSQFQATRFTFSHSDYAAASFAVSQRGATSSGRLSEEDLRDQTAVVNLQAGLVITGLVVDENEKPIAGAKVFRDRAWYLGPDQTTGSDGRFWIGNAENRELTLTIQADGFQARDTTLRPTGNTNDLRFELPRAAVLRGKLVNQDGEPITTANIGANGGDFDSGRFQWATTVDARGHFEWLSAPPSHVLYHVQASGYKALPSLELKPDGTEHVIPLERGTNTPRFRVTGIAGNAETGLPLDAFEVWVGTTVGSAAARPEIRIAPELHTTGTNGRFAFLPRNPRANNYVIEVRSAGYLPAREIVAAPLTNDQRLNLMLTSAPVATGLARLADGKAAPGAVVLLCGGRGDSASMTLPGKLDLDASIGNRAQTDSNGGFVVATTTSTGTVFVAHNSGFCAITVNELAISRTVTLRPWGRVEGLLMIGGKPAAEETVHLNNVITEQPHFLSVWLTTTTDAEGHFFFDGVPPGELRLSTRLKTRDHSTASVPSNQSIAIQVSAGQTTPAVLGGVGRTLVGRIQARQRGESPRWQGYNMTLTTQLPGLASPSRDQFKSVTEYGQALEVWRQARSGFETTMPGRESVVNSREYFARLQPDGTFAINDVIAGIYELTIAGRPEAEVTLSSLDAVRRTRFDGLVREVIVPESRAGEAVPLDLGVWEISLKEP